MFAKKILLKFFDKSRYLKLKIAEKNYHRFQKWISEGQPKPPPHIVKQLFIRSNASLLGLKILVETGTYEGDMAAALCNFFSNVYTIELSSELHALAAKRLANCLNVKVLHGDSSTVLETILPGIQDPALFWLDGHYSGGNTAKGIFSTPILKELSLICTHNVKDHIVFIDDARCFTGSDDYPTKKQLRDNIAGFDEKLQLQEYNDIFIISRKTHPWVTLDSGQFDGILLKDLADA